MKVTKDTQARSDVLRDLCTLGVLVVEAVIVVVPAEKVARVPA